MADDFPIEEPESPTPGSPRKTPASSPPVSASTPRASSPSSSTTGPPSPAAPASSSTGIARSGTVADSSRGKTPLGAWVLRQLGPFRLPEDTVRSMTRSLVTHVRPDVEGIIARDGQWEPGKVRLKMATGMSREDAQRDLATLAPCLRPAAKHAVGPIVGVLKARTKSKQSDPREAAFEAEVILADLSAYPLDVIEYACEYWVTLEEDGKWFPAWSELRAICERRVQPRRALEKALRYVAAGYPENSQ